MSLALGIVGLPNVGKSTLFNALTCQRAPVENYPFCTIDPAVGVVAVPDERLAKLASLFASAKIIPAAVEFVDIAGLVKGAAEGSGLGNQFLAQIREVDAIAEVVRVFDDPNIIHVAGRIDPREDVDIINLELCLADLQTVQKRRASIAKDVKRKDKTAVVEEAELVKIEAELRKGKVAGPETSRHWHLLTAKPILYVLNSAAGAKNVGLKLDRATVVAVDAKTGEGINDLIAAAYKVLGLISFFTTGADETRAWTIKKGAAAPEAGAAIHGDFRDKFIRAEVVPYTKLMKAGSLAAARLNGWLRAVGRDYLVQDGDVIEFKI